MSEIIASIEPPELKDYSDIEFEEIRFNLDSRNGSVWTGITKEDDEIRLEEAQVLEALGYKVGEREQPVKAIWHRDDEEDIEVTVVAGAGLRGGERRGDGIEGGEQLYKISEEDVDVPKSQLEFFKRTDEEPEADVPSFHDRLRKRGANFISRLGDIATGRRVHAYLFNRNRAGEGEPVEGREIVVEDRSRAKVVAGVVGGMALGAFLIWLGSKLGNDQSEEINKLIISQNDMLEEQHLKLGAQLDELNTAVTQNSETLNEINDKIDDSRTILNSLKEEIDELQDAVQTDIGLDRQHLDQLDKNSNGSGGGGVSGESAIQRSFQVESGSGIIREIQEYAKSRGKNLSGQRAYDIYQELRSDFGRRIIDLDGTTRDTYMVGSDIRLSQPGSAHWFPKAGAMLNTLLGK